MPRYRKNSEGNPTTHTVVIGDPATMWAKLAWDVDNFSMIQRGSPDLTEPLGFAAVNVCISAWSLQNWTWAAYAKLGRASTEISPNKEDFEARLHHAVPEQRMCEAIANTSKHANLSEGSWLGGSVRIDQYDPTEVDPGGYVLRHIHPDGGMESLALSAFDDMERNWLDFLKQLGFEAPRHVYDIEFRQRRLESIFGPRDKRAALG